MGIISTVPQLMMALGIAQLLNYRLRARTFFRVSMLLPYATSCAAATIVFAQLYGRDYGVINQFIGLFGFDPIDWEAGRWSSQFAISSIVTWRWTGYNALIYLAGMQAIPHDLYEAAAIDGAGRWRQFRNVTLPGLKPTIVFTVILSSIGATQLFAEPLLFAKSPGAGGGADNQYQTLGVLLYRQGWVNFHLGRAAATAWTMFALIVIVVVVNATVASRTGSGGGLFRFDRKKKVNL
jgi:cellobiose transport system permease protein